MVYRHRTEKVAWHSRTDQQEGWGVHPRWESTGPSYTSYPGFGTKWVSLVFYDVRVCRYGTERDGFVHTRHWSTTPQCGR